MRQSEFRVREMFAESDMDARETEPLVERLSELDRLVDDTVRPGPDLAALIAGMVASATVTPFRRRHARVLVAAAVAFGTVGAGGIAAAANELPPAAQRVVADFSEQYLPFTIPGPEARTSEDVEVTDPTPAPEVSDDGQDRPVEPAATPEATPTPGTQAPAKTPRAKPSKAPSPSTPPAPTSAPVEPEPAPTPSAPTGEATEGSAPVDGSDASAGGEVEPEPATSADAEAAPTPSEPSSSPSPGDSEVNTRPWDGGESGEPSPSPSP